MSYREVDGNLIEMCKQGHFDVVGHGCNCQNVMGSGLAPQMAKAFGCDKYALEHSDYKGDINKLGQIDYETFVLLPDGSRQKNWINGTLPPNSYMLTAVNMYTQYRYGKNHFDGMIKPLDYEALTLCLRKVNKRFHKQRIGLPYVIGCGLAGGDINIVIPMIKRELCDVDITMVNFKK